MDISSDVRALVIALSLGMLVGLQRQWSDSQIAGIRTFGLVTLLGAATAQLTFSLGPWLVVAGFVAVAAFAVTSNTMLSDDGPNFPGQTTEVAMVFMYVVGAYSVLGSQTVAVIMGGTAAVLLQMKKPFKELVGKIGEDDLRAITQFAVLSLIILPVLPNTTFGPYDVLNPRKIWLMVVLIVGINLVGYAGFRVFGQRKGTVLAGALGGLISSTATTASYARAPASDEARTRTAVVVILMASAVVFGRMLVEVFAVSPAFFRTAAPPLVTMGIIAVGLGLVALRNTEAAGGSENLQRQNPSELKPAFLFAALYAVVLLAVAAAEDYLGGAGLYGVAAISGLTDVDAITLSTSELVASARVDPATGWRTIVIAAISNLVFKGGIVAAAGNKRLFRAIAGRFVIVGLVGVALIFFWPS